jgi:hypothetical protein
LAISVGTKIYMELGIRASVGVEMLDVAASGRASLDI